MTLRLHSANLDSDINRAFRCKLFDEGSCTIYTIAPLSFETG